MSQTPALQPLLHERLVVLEAPTQIWSSPDGSIGGSPVDGVYVSDVRVVDGMQIAVDDRPLEHLNTVTVTASHVRFTALARQLDGPDPDPDVRATLDAQATDSGVTYRLGFRSRLAVDRPAEVRVALRADATPMDILKSGLAHPLRLDVALAGDRAGWEAEAVSVRAEFAGARASVEGSKLEVVWSLVIPAEGEIGVSWSIEAAIADAVVLAADDEPPWVAPDLSGVDHRLRAWVERALDDLAGLRLVLPAIPDAPFLAAGAPWFLTLFGRDSIWAARFLLPTGTRIAEGTLRVLAELQGRRVDVDAAEQPGKIMHELRRAPLRIPSEHIELPPLYYGTVDATPLWICLLHDAWRAGLSDDAVRTLLPNLVAALEWMRDFGDSDGDGLLEYVDESGRGLSNQGWKDSGDSVQWRDGRLAEGPIALCEVQGYAYEAAVHGADVLDAFGRDGREWRQWAERLRAAFHERFWVDDGRGAYPAIALDNAKRPVDSLTSNIGHLLGSGLLSPEQARLIADRLVSPELSSGFGLRTLSTDAAGYWPLSYHGGAVWAHDTAIAIMGLVKEGFPAEAAQLAEGLLRAAVVFDFRMPELHSGDPAADTSAPAPYPAACRPQAWSAAAAIVVLHALRS
ncbi:MGH1-like glycoside hydrolase domain-containing protein [Glaciibacter flavus]|uniref:MGH1-like glycoside hydrolase domain-containing protein n=1 Tax=Orlajensenia flava TaxID=2565934 RepID=UPI003B00320B